MSEMNNDLTLDIYENIVLNYEEIFQCLENDVNYAPLESCRVSAKDKNSTICRHIAAFGDSDLKYEFSGYSITPQPWTPLLLEIKKIVEAASGFCYNFVLVNRYQDGSVCLGQHKEDGDNVDENSAVSTLCFGETRTLVFKRSNYADQRFQLKANSLLVMKPPANREWNHGIPRQKKRPGVSIHLTFLMLKTTTAVENKRKAEENLPEDDNNKKTKADGKNKNNGIFTDATIPDDVFPIGDSVFVAVKTFRGDVAVHLRRYKKYGETYYPTAEGVTLVPFWMDCIAGRRCVPQKERDLPGNDFFFPEREIKITSSDFLNFTFTRFTTHQISGETITRSITISVDQWKEMINKFNAITWSILDHMFRSMNLLKAFRMYYEGPLEERLQDSLDVGLGTQYLLQTLQTTLCDILKGRGLKDPREEHCEEEIYGNRIKTFNGEASTIEVVEVAHAFYLNLWRDEPFLCLKPINYVTLEFFKTLRLDCVLRDVRKIFCPDNVTLYFEDLQKMLDDEKIIM